MQSVICLLKQRLDIKEDRKDFQKIFLRHVRHSDCREMKMTVWTLRYVIAEFLEIRITEKTLKELATVLAELGFVDRNTRISITEFFENVIESKPPKNLPKGRKSLNIPILTQRSGKKNPDCDINSPRKEPISSKPKPKPKPPEGADVGHKFTKKQRSVSLTRPIPVNVKMHVTRNAPMKSVEEIKASKVQMGASVCQQPVNTALPSQSSVNDFIRRQRSSNSANSTSNLHESIKLIDSNYKLLTTENFALQKEIATIQAEICEVQKSNNLMRDLTLRLKLKCAAEKDRLDDNMRVLVRTLMNIREIYAASEQSLTCDSPKLQVQKVDAGTTSFAGVPPLMLLTDSNSQTD